MVHITYLAKFGVLTRTICCCDRSGRPVFAAKATGSDQRDKERSIPFLVVIFGSLASNNVRIRRYSWYHSDYWCQKTGYKKSKNGILNRKNQRSFFENINMISDDSLLNAQSNDILFMGIAIWFGGEIRVTKKLRWRGTSRKVKFINKVAQRGAKRMEIPIKMVSIDSSWKSASSEWVFISCENARIAWVLKRGVDLENWSVKDHGERGGDQGPSKHHGISTNEISVDSPSKYESNDILISWWSYPGRAGPSKYWYFDKKSRKKANKKRGVGGVSPP